MSIACAVPPHTPHASSLLLSGQHRPAASSAGSGPPWGQQPPSRSSTPEGQQATAESMMPEGQEGGTSQNWPWLRSRHWQPEDGGGSRGQGGDGDAAWKGACRVRGMAAGTAAFVQCQSTGCRPVRYATAPPHLCMCTCPAPNRRESRPSRGICTAPCPGEARSKQRMPMASALLSSSTRQRWCCRCCHCRCCMRLH